MVLLDIDVESNLPILDDEPIPYKPKSAEKTLSFVYYWTTGHVHFDVEKKVHLKVFVEKAESGYSAYMDDSPLDYGCIGEGVTVEAAIEDFCAAYEEMKAYYATKGMPFTEAEFEFYYDTASFLAEYAGIFSLAGLEKLTGVSQAQLGHYLHGRRKPSRRTIDKIQKGVNHFAKELTAIKFA